MNLTWLDWLLMLVYFAFVLGIGAALKNKTTTSTAFFQAGRAIPAWVCGLAFISANLGAQEIIGPRPARSTASPRATSIGSARFRRWCFSASS